MLRLETISAPLLEKQDLNTALKQCITSYANSSQDLNAWVKKRGARYGVYRGQVETIH